VGTALPYGGKRELVAGVALGVAVMLPLAYV